MKLLLAIAIGAAALAHQPAVVPDLDRHPTVPIGAHGLGLPSAALFGACPGEIIWYPTTDTWRCES